MLREIIRLMLLGMVLLSLAACDESDGQSAVVSVADRPFGAIDIQSVQITRNGDLTPGLPVRYESFDMPRLDELRIQENLEAVIAGGEDEFEKMLLLKDWVAAQWPHGNPDPYPPWDAITILDWIRRGVTGGFCGQYSQVLLQSLAALGFSARYVEIGWHANPYAHFVIEVWSNQFDKWIMMDADYNVHFERRGLPLSALEIHDAYINSDLDDVVAVLGSFREGHSDPEAWAFRTAELYYYMRVHLKADHLSVPDEPPFDRFNDMVEWQDQQTVMWEISEITSSYPKVRLTNLRSSDRVDFAGKVNQVHVVIESWSRNEVILRFENNVVQFDRYQFREVGSRAINAEWRDFDGAVFRWMPSRMATTLEVRGMNIRGVSGPASVVSIYPEPGRFLQAGEHVIASK